MSLLVSVHDQFNVIFGDTKPAISKEIREACHPIEDDNAFLDGMMDAEKGIAHKVGLHADYLKGYAIQKQKEAIGEHS